MSFFDRMLGRNTDESSSAKAKDRLQFILLHERTSIPPEKMRELKAEILEVIAKYVPDLDNVSVDVQVEQSDRYNSKLVAEIPFTQKAPSFPSEIDDVDDDLAAESDNLEAADTDADEADSDFLAEESSSEATDDTLPSFHTAETVKHTPPSEANDENDDEAENDIA